MSLQVLHSMTLVSGLILTGVNSRFWLTPTAAASLHRLLWVMQTASVSAEPWTSPRSTGGPWLSHAADAACCEYIKTVCSKDGLLWLRSVSSEWLIQPARDLHTYPVHHTVARHRNGSRLSHLFPDGDNSNMPCCCYSVSDFCLPSDIKYGSFSSIRSCYK